MSELAPLFSEAAAVVAPRLKSRKARRSLAIESPLPPACAVLFDWLLDRGAAVPDPTPLGICWAAVQIPAVDLGLHALARREAWEAWEAATHRDTIIPAMAAARGRLARSGTLQIGQLLDGCARHRQSIEIAHRLRVGPSHVRTWILSRGRFGRAVDQIRLCGDRVSCHRLANSRTIARVTISLPADRDAEAVSRLSGWRLLPGGHYIERDLWSDLWETPWAPTSATPQAVPARSRLTSSPATPIGASCLCGSKRGSCGSTGPVRSTISGRLLGTVRYRRGAGSRSRGSRNETRQRSDLICFDGAR